MVLETFIILSHARAERFRLSIAEASMERKSPSKEQYAFICFDDIEALLRMPESAKRSDCILRAASIRFLISAELSPCADEPISSKDMAGASTCMSILSRRGPDIFER